MPAPLAEQLRPQTLDEYVGQEHLVGKGAILRSSIESGNIPSMIDRCVAWRPFCGRGENHHWQTDGQGSPFSLRPLLYGTKI